jgi:hypothetical protein
MKHNLNEVKRIQKLAGLITENRLSENEASQAEATADKVADKLEDKIAQLSPEQVNQLKADLDKLGITSDTPAEEVVDKIEGTLLEAEGDEKQKIAYALSDAGGGLMKSMLVPLIPLAVGSATGLGFLGGLGITIATAGLLLGLAKALGAEKTPKNNELSEIRQLVRETINEMSMGDETIFSSPDDEEYDMRGDAERTGQSFFGEDEARALWNALNVANSTSIGSYVAAIKQKGVPEDQALKLAFAYDDKFSKEYNSRRKMQSFKKSNRYR